MSSSDYTPLESNDYSSALSACLRGRNLVYGGQDDRNPAGMVVAAEPYGAYPVQPMVMAPPPYGFYPEQPMAAPMAVPAQPMVAQPMVVPAQPMVAQPMVAQPGLAPPPVVWMAAPGSIPGCPPGLEYLTVVDKVIVEQLIEMMEVFTGIETANRYVVRNAMGQQIYYAMEMSTQGQRTYNGAWRAFTMVITDNAMREVIRIHRPEQPCCSYAEAYIEAPPGEPIGYIKGNFNGFTIYDPSRVPFLTVLRPGYIDKNTQTLFSIRSATGEPIGMMIKHFGGYCKEAMTNADTFSLQFPLDLTAQMKAVLLACVFMVDFRHFEDKH